MILPPARDGLQSVFADISESMASALILNMIYGYSADLSGKDPVMSLGHAMNYNFAQSLLPGKWMVDTMPFLRHLPDWMPGTGFKKTASRMKEWNEAMAEVPYDLVKRRLGNGSQPPSFLSNILQSKDEEMLDEYQVKWSAASMFAGGNDTTAITLRWFIFAMLQYPEVQKKAQEEIDQVIGSSRLPSHSDRKKLPYVENVVRETFRWEPVGTSTPFPS